MSQIHQEVRIEAQEGGAFTCFGNFVSGRNIELVPGERNKIKLWQPVDSDKDPYLPQ